MAGPWVFGVSTLLYRRKALGREQLQAIAARGFRTIELYAERTHFDYHSEAAVGSLHSWLAEAGLTLDAVHAPVAEAGGAGRPEVPLSLASPDAALRERAVSEAEQALYVARRIPIRVLVVHAGLPRALAPGQGDNRRDAVRRSLEALRERAAPLGVQVAVEVIDNELSRPGSLVHLLERDLGAAGLGVCLDLGHAHLAGDVVDAIESVSEHLVAVDVHDNRGRVDEHALPFDGTIDWPTALATVQKVGYDGPLMFELAPRGPAGDVLARGERVRKRMERYLAP
jgi:sugar phosphate isomerase/epimerase